MTNDENTLERFSGTNTDGSTFDMRESVHGDYQLVIMTAEGQRIEKYTDNRARAIQLLIDYKLILPNNETGTTPSARAKAAGLDSLKEVSIITGVHVNTLGDWCRHKPKLFRVVLTGCAQIKADLTLMPS